MRSLWSLQQAFLAAIVGCLLFFWLPVAAAFITFVL